MQEEFSEYLDSEIRTMLNELKRTCTLGSPEFNELVIAWVRKNAAQFREQWNKQHSRNELIA